MTDPSGEGKPEGAENDKMLPESNNDVTLNMDSSDPKVNLINANGGAGGDHDDEFKTTVSPTPASSDGEVSFNGLGKEEVMKYATDPFWVRLRWILFILFWVGWIAMLVTAVAIIVLAPRCPPRPDLKWYNTEAVYQVFPKSFKDSDGDGIGDFEGLKEKEDYIIDTLGSKAIWLNSIYKTDGKDSGIGVVDHMDIDMSFGVTVDQFKSWLKKMRKDGKKVILDLIPNQTSKNHTWFIKSQQKDEQYKDYYVWANNTNGQPPNNWESVYGGSAWTLDPVRNAWYFHQFSADHPDLNLNNEDVRNEIKDIMKFWMDGGVSGFYIQGLEYLVENPDMKDDDAMKSQTRNYEGTLEFLEELRAVANQYSDKPGREKVLFGTVLHASKNQTLEYWGPKDNKRLHIVSPLMDELNGNCKADCMKDMIEERLVDSGHQWLGLQLGNQDISRIATRLGNDYKKTLTIAHAVQLLLPGTVFNYYADEFGQRDGSVGAAQQVDKMGRDAFRTPMQWSTEENAGFTDGVSPWLPVGPEYATDNVMAGQAHFTPTSLKAFEQLLDLRKSESFQWGKTQVCAPNPDLLLISRKATRFPYFVTVINTSDKEIHASPDHFKCVPTKKEGKVEYHSREHGEKVVGEMRNIKDYAVSLQPYDVIVLKFAADD